MYKISYLQEFPHHIDICARWAFTTWGHYNQNASLERSVTNFTQHLQRDALPLTLLALDQEKPIAMASLRATDGIRPHLQPWLGSLYVPPLPPTRAWSPLDSRNHL
jgi:hypothetical protein